MRREPLTLSTVKRMYSFFSRHEVDKSSKSWKEGNSKAEQAWLGWGGDAGFRWSRGIVNREKKKDSASDTKETTTNKTNKKKESKYTIQLDSGDIVGKRVPKPTTISKNYVSTLEKLVKKMTDDTDKQLKKLISSQQAKDYDKLLQKNTAQDAKSYVSLQQAVLNALITKWTNAFKSLSKPISQRFINKVNNKSKQSFMYVTDKMPFDSKKATLRTPANLKESIKGAVNENVDLIKTLPTEYLVKLKADLNRAIAGESANYADIQESIEKSFIKRTGQVKRRARNIARDQTNKAYSSFNRTRFRNAKCSKFVWQHNGGAKEPRPLHKDVLNGQAFSYDDPPVIDEKTGLRGLPAEDYNCGCTERPVFPV